jgi:hypothetical protein
MRRAADQRVMTTRAVSVLAAVAASAALALVPAGAAAKATAPKHKGLWATVNRCGTPAKPGAVGVRVSIPREKGAPQQWARIRLQWFDGAKRAWRLLRSSAGDSGWARLGLGTRLVQGGTTFSIAQPKAGMRVVVRGIVDVEWRDGTDVVDETRLTTTDGHRDPADRERKISRSSCELVG